tara:strand:- start:8618 stop:9337 length:720 start_codon:yes stop_codon:yes gene_type:complete
VDNYCIIASGEYSWSYRLINNLNNLKLENTKFVMAMQDQAVRDEIKIGKEKNARIRIFYFHWSGYITDDIFENNECITIHTSNLPHGRGGTPIQNQILDGITRTRVNALKTVKEFDAGPIFCTRTISLQGCLNDIWYTIADAATELIREIILYDPKPVEQSNLHYNSNITNTQSYKRLKGSKNPLDSETLHQVYDIIRMLDAETYPKAACKVGQYTLEFSRAQLKNNNEVLCDLKIKMF